MIAFISRLVTTWLILFRSKKNMQINKPCQEENCKEIEKGKPVIYSCDIVKIGEDSQENHGGEDDMAPRDTVQELMDYGEIVFKKHTIYLMRYDSALHDQDRSIFFLRLPVYLFFCHSFRRAIPGLAVRRRLRSFCRIGKGCHKSIRSASVRSGHYKCNYLPKK